MKRIIAFIFLLFLFSCQPKTEKERPIPPIVEENKTEIDSTTPSTVATRKNLDTLLNSKDYLILGEKIGKVKIIKEEDIKKHPSFEVITGFKDDIIIADQIADEQIQIFIK